MSTSLDPAGFAKALMYEASDIPPDMTLAQWRLEKRSPAPRSRRRRRVVRLRRLALSRPR
jgi:hypothetical protein